MTFYLNTRYFWGSRMQDKIQHQFEKRQPSNTGFSFMNRLNKRISKHPLRLVSFVKTNRKCKFAIPFAAASVRSRGFAPISRALCKSTALCWMISVFRFHRSHLLDFLRRERVHMWHLTASVTSFTSAGSVPGEPATSRANFFARSLMEFVRRWTSKRVPGNLGSLPGRWGAHPSWAD